MIYSNIFDFLYIFTNLIDGTSHWKSIATATATTAVVIVVGVLFIRLYNIRIG